MPATPQSAGCPPPPPPPPSMGSLAMGMPFQVFPTGPPPPPPMKNQQLHTPQTNGNATRKSPQHYEPPPMGCRPEIKIPENPMAALKKVPKPQPRDDYWIQEYVQDKGRNSIPSEEDFRQSISSPVMQQYQQQPEPVFTPPTPIAQQKPVFTPPPPIVQPKPASPIIAMAPQYVPQRRSPSPPPQPHMERSEINIPIRNMKLEEVRSASPLRVQINQSPTQHVTSSSPVTVTRNVTMEPIQPNNFNKQAQSYQPPAQGGKIILSTMPNRQPQAQQHVSHLS
jgi:hypothetical protein